ncbi:6-carboxytetrahydropterin synthase QueD [Desulfovibrio legallii]|jgi:6-pyruvoyltetrahydropterin/6-carboxytetrahydropterin synthase|uniref:6-carboxy-5,6,7,8-tetrahydropterin synthase n=1 Tax=Desulfovibrio legallii TaxID=571438 RepID=A0A1G7I146_9BACT|nr:6-carboxytetrahydropterin synthase QueD [Desulfovibrio legallii]SDF06375.1 6-pyruvoyltetrahydropterin/6-carboxytetrahydropterin synthase [Desulfovibrio legallii]
MNTHLWRLTVRDDFAAAHALRHYEGKCERLHGHNFAVELAVEGQNLTPDTEMLLDFKVLKTGLKAVLEALDHRLLNETPPFDRLNPSSENLARHIWRGMEAWLAGQADPQARAVRLYSVTVAEKGAQSATYMELPPLAAPRG